MIGPQTPETKTNQIGVYSHLRHIVPASFVPQNIANVENDPYFTSILHSSTLRH